MTAGIQLQLLLVAAALHGAAAVVLRRGPRPDAQEGAAEGHPRHFFESSANDGDELQQQQHRAQLELQFGKPSVELPQIFPRLVLDEDENATTWLQKEKGLEVDGGPSEFNWQRLNWAQIEDSPLKPQAPQPLKLLIWTPIVTALWDVQQAHRDTWMNRPGVCHVSRYADSECSFFPVWVFGNVTNASRLANISAIAGDLIHTIFSPDISEPKNESVRWPQMLDSAHILNFKTPFAVRYIQQNYKWATHVVRMDADAFPYLSLIRGDLERLPQQGLVYGRMDKLSNERHGKYPPCTNRTVVGYFSLVSRDLLDCWVEQASHRDRFRTQKQANWDWPLEDEIFSNVLFDAQHQGVCPRLTCVGITGAAVHRVEHPV